ncbi:MAG: N-acetyltransferase family protein [Burkholderiales bacterium]
MAAYPAELEKRLRLRDGRMVHIRPVRRDDDLAERDFIQHLSGETRYLRFQKWVHAPSDRLIHFLTDVDHDKHLALLGTHARDGGEEVVGEARYVAAPDGRSCELGIVIADAWQKSGLAGVLMDALMQAARARGLRRMEGLVLATNRPMLRFVRALGFRVEPVPEDRTLVRIVKEL